ncbi:hypothetical protein K490DRAFT_68726 [Saccharata proteae CBS 121410]|uniref:Uncharacterized protein n=1 Tax=Saccharata proteae CBS 121410 TaxID=1314787 RepID=A0A9P4LUR3_9PEZI|nr:hypothetical protein K490DRAFT_68726 [Saccharata proteae CBS 121410]
MDSTSHSAQSIAEPTPADAASTRPPKRKARPIFSAPAPAPKRLRLHATETTDGDNVKKFKDGKFGNNARKPKHGDDTQAADESAISAKPQRIRLKLTMPGEQQSNNPAADDSKHPAIKPLRIKLAMSQPPPSKTPSAHQRSNHLGPGDVSCTYPDARELAVRREQQSTVTTTDNSDGSATKPQRIRLTMLETSTTKLPRGPQPSNQRGLADLLPSAPDTRELEMPKAQQTLQSTDNTAGNSDGPTTKPQRIQLSAPKAPPPKTRRVPQKSSHVGQADLQHMPPLSSDTHKVINWLFLGREQYLLEQAGNVPSTHATRAEVPGTGNEAGAASPIMSWLFQGRDQYLLEQASSPPSTDATHAVGFGTADEEAATPPTRPEQQTRTIAADSSAEASSMAYPGQKAGLSKTKKRIGEAEPEDIDREEDISAKKPPHQTDKVEAPGYSTTRGSHKRAENFMKRKRKTAKAKTEKENDSNKPKHKKAKVFREAAMSLDDLNSNARDKARADRDMRAWSRGGDL